MAKTTKQTVYFCQECGCESTKWVGQCPACKAWNTMVEEVIDKRPGGHAAATSVLSSGAAPTAINDISTAQGTRINSGINELNRVLGGGIVSGSMVLVGGDPGIGKSTLLLQTCRLLAESGQNVLYVSGEESLEQIKIRADRIGAFTNNLRLLCETNLGTIKAVIEREKPAVVIIDSIQTMYNEEVGSAPGSVSQVRETTGVLLQIAKGLNIAVFIVGHVTKEGTVAGPRVLEHMVDTVLYFEGDRHASYRILRGVKNRFGSTNEIGVFEMREEGLVEVANPSEYMLEGRPDGASGSIVACSMEGTRPLLIEIQALVSHTVFNFPKRTAAGCDANRVNLLMAVLDRCIGGSGQSSVCRDYDIYVNLTGGIRVLEPAIDLALIIAIYSSYRNKSIDAKTICFGEIGLSGEVRSVSQPAARVREAMKLGFTTCILPESCMKALGDIKTFEGIKIIPVKTVRQALDVIA